MNEQLTMVGRGQTAFGEIAEWLERMALRGIGCDELVAGVSEGLVAAGIPLSRTIALVDTLHPVHEGSLYRWTAGGSGAETRVYDRDYDQSFWEQSSYYHLDREALTVYRARLRPGEEPELPSLREYRDAGMRDVLVIAERFEDSGSIGEMTCVYSTWLTEAREGFSDLAVATIRRLSPVLALALKCQTLHGISATIAETYLGRNAAAQVMQGKILRGTASKIEAVLWTSDLMGFTALSEALEAPEVIPFLNAYAGAVVEAVGSEGGDVLKFMGDGLLAIFPVDGDPAAACRAALRAEREARRLVGELNRARAAEALRTTDFYLSLHLGRVYFGNIGSADRLDFTVIGQAANEGSRILELCRSVRRPLLLSARFAETVTGGTCEASEALPLASVGRFALRDVAGAQHLYTLA